MAGSTDSLTLPSVPAPAAAAHPARDRILALLFCAAIAAIGLAALKPRPEASLEFENRPIAAWPALTLTRSVATGFEAAFSDRFGARTTLLRWHHALLVDVFHVSPASNVMLGRNGWLYFLGEDGQSLDRNYRGTVAVADGDIAAVVAELGRRGRFLASLGIPYVVAVVPDKFTIYPEHLPAWVVRAAGRTPLDRLADAIVAGTTLRFVDLRAPLRAAKARERVYYATDSHWNLLGATVAYGEIMREVQRALPAGRLPAIAPAALPEYLPGVDVYSGDLARFIGYPPRVQEPDYAPLGKVLADPASRCGKRLDSGADIGYEYYACDHPNRPRAVVYRDSMAIPLIPLLSENFSRAVYISSHRFDPALIERERPDVVIEEMVERAMFAPAATPMPNP